MALCLTRNSGEAIIIGGHTRIEVREMKTNRGKCYQLIIDAPKEVTVHREEIQNRIDEQREGE